MNLLSDIITYVRRIIKSASNEAITDDLLIDYINRFWIMDVDARIQLFDLKTKYQFMTSVGVDKYNMPLYSLQLETPNQQVGMYPVYQGFFAPAYINGVNVRFQTQKELFFNNWLNVTNNALIVGQGDGSAGPYVFRLPFLPSNPPIPNNPPLNSIIRGHIDLMGIMQTGVNQDPPLATNLTMPIILPKIPTTSIDGGVFITTTGSDGGSVVVQDSGIFLEGNVNYGLLIEPGKAPYGNQLLTNPSGDAYSVTSNVINYQTGEIFVYFNQAIPAGNNISVQCNFFTSGLPREMLFYNNVLTLRSPPALQYLVEIDAYLSPAAFFNSSNAVQFAYMSEYIARGAARKILSDTGDIEQFQFYEPLFREQETLVWKRSQRQFTATRTPTIYAGNNHAGGYNGNHTGLGL